MINYSSIYYILKVYNKQIKDNECGSTEYKKYLNRSRVCSFLIIGIAVIFFVLTFLYSTPSMDELKSIFAIGIMLSIIAFIVIYHKDNKNGIRYAKERMEAFQSRIHTLNNLLRDIAHIDTDEQLKLFIEQVDSQVSELRDKRSSRNKTLYAVASGIITGLISLLTKSFIVGLSEESGDNYYIIGNIIGIIAVVLIIATFVCLFIAVYYNWINDDLMKCESFLSDLQYLNLVRSDRESYDRFCAKYRQNSDEEVSNE